jgi:hypothetical protein
MISIVVFITLVAFLKIKKKSLIILAVYPLVYIYDKYYRKLEVFENLILGQIIMVLCFLFINKIIRLSMKSPTISLQNVKNDEEAKIKYIKYLFECYLTRCNKLLGLEVSMDTMNNKKEIVVKMKLSLKIIRKLLNILNRFLSLGARSG